MTYNIRYLAIHIGSLKVCNVRYMCHTSIRIWNFIPETQLSVAFYHRVSMECSIMVSKSADGIAC